jgi:hypothetical protein
MKDLLTEHEIRIVTRQGVAYGRHLDRGAAIGALALSDVVSNHAHEADQRSSLMAVNPDRFAV